MAVVARKAPTTTVRSLPDFLRPGDLVVVNTSATLPAAVDVDRQGCTWPLHVSTQLDDGSWVVELRLPDGSGPAEPHRGRGPPPARRCPAAGRRRRTRPPSGGCGAATPLPAVDRSPYLTEHGRPIRYPYLDGDWPLSAWQNVYADQPGSAEMPSAGRPLTTDLLVRLMARGIPVAPVVLHTGVSSQEAHEPPQPEEYTVPEVTARLVNGTVAAGRRVVAVGTTVVRALESAAPAGRVVPTSGWTDLVLGPRRPARVVSGLLTGLHEPAASHLDLLEAVAGRRLVDRGYADVTGRRRRPATCGTSSATPCCCCPDLPGLTCRPGRAATPQPKGRRRLRRRWCRSTLTRALRGCPHPKGVNAEITRSGVAAAVALEVRRDQPAEARQVVAALLDGDRRQARARRAAAGLAVPVGGDQQRALRVVGRRVDAERDDQRRRTRRRPPTRPGRRRASSQRSSPVPSGSGSLRVAPAPSPAPVSAACPNTCGNQPAAGSTCTDP